MSREVLRVLLAFVASYALSGMSYDKSERLFARNPRLLGAYILNLLAVPDCDFILLRLELLKSRSAGSRGEAGALINGRRGSWCFSASPALIRLGFRYGMRRETVWSVRAFALILRFRRLRICLRALISSVAMDYSGVYTRLSLRSLLDLALPRFSFFAALSCSAYSSSSRILLVCFKYSRTWNEQLVSS